MDPRPQLFGLSDARRKALRRWLFGGMVGLFLVGILLGFGPLFVAVWRLPEFCASVPAGTALEAARTRALERGYEVEPRGEGRLRVMAPRMADRVENPRGCEWTFGPQGLASARYADSL